MDFWFRILVLVITIVAFPFLKNERRPSNLSFGPSAEGWFIYSSADQCQGLGYLNDSIQSEHHNSEEDTHQRHFEIPKFRRSWAVHFCCFA